MAFGAPHAPIKPCCIPRGLWVRCGVSVVVAVNTTRAADAQRRQFISNGLVVRATVDLMIDTPAVVVSISCTSFYFFLFDARFLKQVSQILWGARGDREKHGGSKKITIGNNNDDRMVIFGGRPCCFVIVSTTCAVNGGNFHGVLSGRFSIVGALLHLHSNGLWLFLWTALSLFIIGVTLPLWG